MLRRLWVQNFRNLSEQIINFDPGVTVIVGDNNQGKTNLLEAIYCAAFGKPILGERFSDLVNYDTGSSAFALELTVDDGRRLRIYREIDRNGTKRPTLDGRVLKQREVLDGINPVYWSADIIRSFQESADNRRELLDQISKKCDPNYVTLSKAYERVLAQRNAALKSKSSVLVALYTTPLVELSYKISLIRQKVLDKVFKIVNGYLDELKIEEVQDLKPVLILKKLDSHRYIESMNDVLRDSADKEYFLGYTTVGAHRDDFDVVYGTKSIIQFFSRGISRVLSVLIHLSELEIREAAGVVVLIDDAFCEIADRLKISLGSLIFSRFQCVYVSTDIGDCRRFGRELDYRVLTKGVLVRGEN